MPVQFVRGPGSTLAEILYSMSPQVISAGGGGGGMGGEGFCSVISV